MTTTLETSFQFLSIFLILAGIGIWLIFNIFRNNIQNKEKFITNDMLVFVLLTAIFGVYTSSAFIRLELFASISVIILSSIGLSILIKHLFNNIENNSRNNSLRSLIKISSIFVLICLLVIPLVLPQNTNWVDYAKYQATILNGGSSYNVVHGDWPHALNWMKSNTPSDSVIFSWWDYGYWITTIGDRISLADNATLVDWQIEKIARTFISSPEDAWVILDSDYKTNVVEHFVNQPTINGKLISPSEYKKPYCDDPSQNPAFINPQDLNPSEYYVEECDILGHYLHQITGIDADYVVIFIAGMKLTGPNLPPYYILEGGGDESKMTWYMKIGGVDQSEFVESDNHTPKNAFWNTMLGKMIPFRIVGYADPSTDAIYDSYQNGLVPVYTPEIKYPNNGDGPFKLVYTSPSIDRIEKGPVTAILIYEINKDYKKLN